MQHVARVYRAAFPDLHLAIEETLAVDDAVVVRVTERGAHLGPFLGTPPTGRRVVWRWIGIYRVRGGQLVECWGVIESAELLRQLGLVSGPTSAS